MASTSQKVHMLKAPSRPPTPENTISRFRRARLDWDHSLTIFRQLRIVPVYQPGAGQSALLRGQQDAVHGVEEHGVVRRDEEDQGRNQDGRVQHFPALVALNEALHLFIVPFLHDLFVEGFFRVEPFRPVRAGQIALFGEAKATVKGYPQHDLGIGEVLLVVSHLPDRHVGLVHDGEHIVQHITNRAPQLPVDGLAILIVQINAVHELAVDVKLLVEGSTVSDAHRAAPSVSLEVRQLQLGNFCLTADGEHDGQGTVGTARLDKPLGDEPHIGICLCSVAKT